MTDLLDKHRWIAERHARMLSLGVNAVGLTNDRILSPTRAMIGGRETILATGGGPAWRALLTSLTRGGRSVYWLQNRYAEPPRAPDVAFGPVGGTSDMTIDLPPSPPDTPPNVVIRKIVPLQLYGVTARS